MKNMLIAVGLFRRVEKDLGPLNLTPEGNAWVPGEFHEGAWVRGDAQLLTDARVPGGGVFHTDAWVPGEREEQNNG